MELLKRGLREHTGEKRFPQTLVDSLDERKSANNYRTLSDITGLIDFSSNDYLGFSTSGILHNAVRQRLEEIDTTRMGSTGSRLLAGNSAYIEKLEAKIARHHRAEAALIFNSGYDANLGLISSIAKRQDTILYDELCHASIIDGTRLALTKHRYSFVHNDLDSLRDKLKQSSGVRYIVVESVYSMDGDFAPLEELADLCDEMDAFLIVDEAHATGIFGHQGAGRVAELGLSERVFARIHTFGKALGCHGAAVVGNTTLREFLINFARPFIYTTALDYHALVSIDTAYSILTEKEFSPMNIFLLINEFRNGVKKYLPDSVRATLSPIQAIRTPGNTKARSISAALREKGLAAHAILHPTVPEGLERIRVCLHSFNAPPEVQLLIHTVSETV